MEEAFFHNQPSTTTDCVSFIIKTHVSNTISHLQSRIVPKTVEQWCELLKKSLMQDIEGLAYKEKMQTLAIRYIEDFTSNARKQCKALCMEYLKDTINGKKDSINGKKDSTMIDGKKGSTISVNQMVENLLPSSAPENIIIACSNVVRRQCVGKVEAWLQKHLHPTVTKSMLVPAAIKVLREALRNVDLTAKVELNFSAESANISTNLSKNFDATSIVQPLKSNAELKEVEKDFHNDSAPAPSLILSEMKLVVNTLLNPNVSSFPSILPARYHQISNENPVGSVSSEDGSYRCRILRNNKHEISARYLISLHGAIIDCMTERDDMTSSLKKRLRLMSIDIYFLGNALMNDVMEGDVSELFISLWLEKGVLSSNFIWQDSEEFASLSATALCPRVVRAIEVSVGHGILPASASCFDGLYSALSLCLQNNLLQRHDVQENILQVLRNSWSHPVRAGLSNISKKLLVNDDDTVDSWLPWALESMNDCEDF